MTARVVRVASLRFQTPNEGNCSSKLICAPKNDDKTGRKIPTTLHKHSQENQNAVVVVVSYAGRKSWYTWRSPDEEKSRRELENDLCSVAWVTWNERNFLTWCHTMNWELRMVGRGAVWNREIGKEREGRSWGMHVIYLRQLTKGNVEVTTRRIFNLGWKMFKIWSLVNVKQGFQSSNTVKKSKVIPKLFIESNVNEIIFIIKSKIK